MTVRARLAAVAAVGLAAPLAGCAGAAEVARPAPASGPGAASGPAAGASPGAGGPRSAQPSPSPPRTAPATPTDAGPERGDGAPARARLSVPGLGIRGLLVVPYRGRTDDAAGTRIQDGGRAASPHGPRGGTGPGGVGNYQVTAHRLSSTQAFRRLPDLRRGDRVHVVAGGTRWTYAVRDTRITSFRDPASLRAQRAAVPGREGVEPTRAMITLSTCRTIEDHAEGNYWSDELDNPEHRIDKIGALVARSPA